MDTGNRADYWMEPSAKMGTSKQLAYAKKHTCKTKLGCMNYSKTKKKKD